MQSTVVPLLSVRDLAVRFDTPAGVVRAVDDVSFDLARGETLCIVGESGSGKSVTGRAIMQIVDKPGVIDRGSILFAPEPPGAPVDIAGLPPRSREMRALRGARISMIFQEPMSSLSPVHTIGDQIGEVLRLHRGLSRKQARAGAIEALGHVGIPDPAGNVDRYPFEYSGGMRQRVMIAMATACRPNLIIADEPTTALDVTTQADILDLLMRIRQELGIGLLFITHDLGVVAEIADRVMVMNNGRPVEMGTTQQVLTAPSHAYSRALIGAVQRLERRAPSKVAKEQAAAKPVLQTDELTVQFAPPRRLLRPASVPFVAVNAVSFSVRAGETLGIVGESGSGKTTLARSILRIVEPSDGSVTVRPRDGAEIVVDRGHRDNLRQVRKVTRFVFQDPYASLNPRMTVAQILAEPLHAHGVKPPEGTRAYIRSLLQDVGLSPSAADRYPHAFSGGQRQRIGIARALALKPEILIADEATSALDVSLRAHMLDLLIDLQNRLGLTYVFITHDMGVVRYFCDTVAVMRRGEIVEFGSVDMVCGQPRHVYTQTLLASVPLADPRMLSARGESRRARYGQWAA